MKLHRFWAFCLCFLAGSLLLPLSIFANTQAEPTQDQRIQSMLQKTMDTSKIPCVSAAAMGVEETQFYSIDRINWNDGRGIDETTLFEIGSVSKSFTGFAVLLLVQRGQILLDAPITQYIPWLTLNYEGNDVTDTITIANLLYQQSGFTNNEKYYPSASPGMSLEDNVRNLSGRTLSFQPGSRFNYANANYNLLGYIIEQASGQSYPDFMQQQVLSPLGLNNTYANLQQGIATGRLLVGSRVAFRTAFPYNEAPLEGDLPAGFILSCSKDLARWAQIHLGLAELPAEYAEVVQRSHEPGANLNNNSPLSYAAGWYINRETGFIYHSGGTNNFSSYLALDPATQTASCVLANMNASANTADMALNILTIINGGQELQYSNDIWTVMDVIFLTILIVAALACLLLVVLFIRLPKKQSKPKSKWWFALPAVCLLLLISMLVVFPIAFVSNWPSILQWGPITILCGLTAFSAFILLLFIYTFAATKKQKI